MRELKTKDVFTMSRILKKINLNIDPDGKSQEQVGADVVLSIGENLHLAENEVNDFIGGLIGMTGKEFSELSLRESKTFFEEFKNQPGISDFFKLVGQLMKQQKS